jgi:hypothetical protein
MIKHQIQSTKFQTNPKFPILKVLNFGSWNLLGAWDFEFGISTE